MLYKKVTILFKEGDSIFSLEYQRVMITVSGNYLILSIHNDDSTEVTTEVHNLDGIKNWRTYIN